MLKVGLTGGYASGKSFVAAEFQRLGCYVVYADKLGHAVLLPDGEAYAPTVEAFGDEILAGDRTIDRKRLGSIVFASPNLLAQLTSFVHPAVSRLEETLLSRFAESNPNGIVIVEAAILIETGRYKFFDRVILTACSQEVQIVRAMTRDGLTREQVLSRLANQMPVLEKISHAHFTINTDGAKAETITQVEQTFESLRKIETGPL